MKFFLWFVAATILFVLVARFKPQAPAEPLIPTEMKESQGRPGADDHAPPARTEEQGQQDAKAKQGPGAYVQPVHRAAALV